MQPVTQSSYQSPGQPLGGTNSDLRYRFLHFHVPIALVSAAVLIMWMSFPLFQTAGHQGPPQAAQTKDHQGSSAASTPSAAHQGENHQVPSQTHGDVPSMDHNGNQNANPDRMENRLLFARFTNATGYIALGLIGLTLLIGPANLLLRRRTPVSSYLARDIGMWAAIISVIHVIVGFFVHGPPAPFVKRILFYFFTPDGSPLTNGFGMGNWTGLAGTVIVVGLLAISNDFSLRKLKAKRWKNLQRLNYALFTLVLVHAIFYGALLRITSITTILLGFIVSLVFLGQLIGIWLWRRRQAPVRDTTV
jgi:sulfoxide reductase heme-binding subunit YedZ